jgi:hypothetical protein
MKKVASFLVIAAIVMFTGAAFAQVETTVFGPEK